jgi:hypothetical protein
MPAPYIPQADLACEVWTENFRTRITANPGLYGLAAGDAVAIAAVCATWSAALLLAQNPATKTSVTVAAKDAAKAAALSLCRLYAQMVRRNAGVSNGDKTDLGLTIIDPTPTPVPAPTSAPLLEITGATPLQLTMRFHDANTPLTRAKPAGAMFLAIHAATSATVISDPDTLPLKKLATRQPIALDWEASDDAKTAYICARYVTGRGLVGPWSTIQSYTIVGAGT